MLVLGLILGAVSGLLGGFIPGFTSGFAYLLLGAAAPDFAVGFILASDATSSLIKQLGILTPSVLVTNTYISEDLPFILRKGKGIAAVLTGAYAYTFTKMLVLVGGIVLLFFGGAGYLKIALAHQVVAVIFAIIMWGTLARKSENKVAAIVILILATTLGWFTSNLSGNNLMFALITSVIGIPGVIEMINSQSTTLPAQTDRKVREELPLGPIVAGAASSLFMGLPTAAIMEAMEDDEKDQFARISKSAVAEAAASGYGLLLAVSNGGARSVAATMLDQVGSDFNSWAAIGMLGLTLMFTLATYLNMEGLADLYIATVGKINQKFFGYVIIALSAISVLYCAGPIGFVLMAAGFFLNKMIQAAGVPQSCSLIAFSAIPLLSLLGI